MLIAGYILLFTCASLLVTISFFALIALIRQGRHTEHCAICERKIEITESGYLPVGCTYIFLDNVYWGIACRNCSITGNLKNFIKVMNDEIAH